VKIICQTDRWTRILLVIQEPWSSRFEDLRVILAVASMISTGIQMVLIEKLILKNKDVALAWVVINPIVLLSGGYKT